MIASRHLEFVIVLIASLVAIYLGSHLVMLPPAGVAIVVSLIFVAVWALTAGDAWWAPVLVLTALQGVFYIGGIKIQPPHLAFAMAVVGIAPLFLVQKDKLFQGQRAPLPAVFYLTAIYLGIHFTIDILPVQGPRSNLFRIAFDYTWPFAFGFLFYHYGRLGPAKAAVVILFILLLIRTACGLIGYVAGIPLYIPGINYVLSFGAEDSLLPMRSVASLMVVVSLVCYHWTRSIFLKVFLIPVLFFSEVMLVMGEGRFATFLGLLLPMAFFAWSRRWLPVVAVGLMTIGVVGFVNLFPRSLDALPHGAHRALSGLVFNQEAVQSEAGTAGSDEWHDALRVEGFKRLTSSPTDFFFGDGIHPSPDLYDVKKSAKDQLEAIQIAANLGAYESSLMATLAVLGVVGYALYALMFIGLWRRVFPYFWRRPQGTFWEGILFWGCYSSVMWFVTGYFVGAAPAYELVVMLLVLAAANDGKLDRKVPGPIPSKNLVVGAPRLVPAAYTRSQT